MGTRQRARGDPAGRTAQVDTQRPLGAYPKNKFFWEKIGAAPLILEDPKHSHQEARFHALGKSDDNRQLHITFTLRQAGEKIRVISARDMYKKERAIYEKAT